MTKIKVIGKELLSNGDTLQITKLGRQYQVSTLHYDNSPPIVELRLNKKQAYARWSEIVRHDILELDD